MAGRFEQWITKLRLPWMDDKAKAILGGQASIVGDRTLAYASQANCEHLPLLAKDPISVGLIASERQIEPGPTETQAALSARLVAAVTQWQLAGSPIGLLLALYYAEFPGAFLVTQNGVAYTLSGTPDLDDLTTPNTSPPYSVAAPGPALTIRPPWYSKTTLGPNPAISAVAAPPAPRALPVLPARTSDWWTFDWSSLDANGDQFNSRFAVLFPAPSTVDLSVPENLSRIRRCINKWRPAKASCKGIFVVTAGRTYGWPVTTYDAIGGGTYGGNTVTNYTA